jgi:MFS family permease
MLMLGVSVAVSTAYLDGPDKKNATFGLSSTWGFCMGWTYPSQRVLFVTLSPKGQEAEIMGCFFFIGQVLGWLPPLLFTVMNEHGVNMRWGFGVISFFCAFAVLCTLPMGSYRHATELVARESEAKFQSVLAAASQHNNYSSGVMGSGRRAGSVTKPVTTADDNGAKVERELAMGMDPEDKKDLRAPNS